MKEPRLNLKSERFVRVVTHRPFLSCSIFVSSCYFFIPLPIQQDFALNHLAR